MPERLDDQYSESHSLISKASTDYFNKQPLYIYNYLVVLS